MKRLTPVKSIANYCLECSGNSRNERKLCVIKDDCPLYPYRLGKNPNRKGIKGKINPASLKALKEYRERKRQEKGKV